MTFNFTTCVSEGFGPVSRDSAVKINCVSRQHDKEHVLYFSDYPALQVRTTTESNNHIRVRVSSTLNPRQQPGY